MRFDKEITDAGVVVASESLADLVTQTRVQVDNDGKRTVTDGPFAETREVLGGFYVIDVPDLDVALDWAAKCPGSRGRRFGRRAADRGVPGRMTMDQVEAVFREERGRLLAALARRFGDLDLAEEVAAEAIEAALVRWPVDGVPPNPGGWLMTTARRKAVDRLRRDQVYAAKLAILQVDADRAEPPRPGGEFPDDRLELFFTCAHPALAARGSRRADAALSGRAEHA